MFQYINNFNFLLVIKISSKSSSIHIIQIQAQIEEAQIQAQIEEAQIQAQIHVQAPKSINFNDYPILHYNLLDNSINLFFDFVNLFFFELSVYSASHLFKISMILSRLNLK